MFKTIPDLAISDDFGAEALAIVTAKPWETHGGVSPDNGLSLSFERSVGSYRTDFMKVTISMWLGRSPRPGFRFYTTFEARVSGWLDYGSLGEFPTLTEALETVTGHLDGFAAATSQREVA